MVFGKFGEGLREAPCRTSTGGLKYNQEAEVFLRLLDLGGLLQIFQMSQVSDWQWKRWIEVHPVLVAGVILL